MMTITRSGILERVLTSSTGKFEPELARYFISMHFPPEDQRRCDVLARKAQDGELTPQEQDEIEEYMRVSNFLALLQSMARRALKGDGTL